MNTTGGTSAHKDEAEMGLSFNRKEFKKVDGLKPFLELIPKK